MRYSIYWTSLKLSDEDYYEICEIILPFLIGKVDWLIVTNNMISFDDFRFYRMNDGFESNCFSYNDLDMHVIVTIIIIAKIAYKSGRFIIKNRCMDACNCCDFDDQSLFSIDPICNYQALQKYFNKANKLCKFKIGNPNTQEEEFNNMLMMRFNYYCERYGHDIFFDNGSINNFAIFPLEDYDQLFKKSEKIKNILLAVYLNGEKQIEKCISADLKFCVDNYDKLCKTDQFKNNAFLRNFNLNFINVINLTINPPHDVVHDILIILSYCQ